MVSFNSPAVQLPWTRTYSNSYSRWHWPTDTTDLLQINLPFQNTLILGNGTNCQYMSIRLHDQPSKMAPVNDSSASKSCPSPSPDSWAMQRESWGRTSSALWQREGTLTQITEQMVLWSCSEGAVTLKGWGELDPSGWRLCEGLITSPLKNWVAFKPQRVVLTWVTRHVE
jgi:hypothetical protein